MVMGELPVETGVLVMGGGPAGYTAAFRAADLGLDVTLVTDDPQIGGVCLLRGCIASKTLLSLSELISMSRAAAPMGLHFEEPKVELNEVRAWTDKVVKQLGSGLNRLCEQRGVNWVQARATFHGADTVHLDNGEVHSIAFKHAIVATGSRPLPLPDTPFSHRIMDSSKALELEDLPNRLLVVGGGYVGLEMGLVYAVMGSQVTLVEMTDRLLPNADADLVKPLARRLRDCFESVHCNTKVVDLKPDKKKVQVTFKGETDLPDATYDRVLVAIGRQPNTDDLGLDRAEVELDDQGYVVVDAQQRTTNARIFAIGDAAGGRLLAHEAMHEGRVAAEAMAGLPAASDARAIPSVVYTDPQIAWCGLTEREAKAQALNVKVARFPWKASGRAVSMGAADGFTKLIMDAETHHILGVGMVGPHAETLIAEGALAVEMGALAQDVGLTVHPHPTLSETVGEAAQTLLGSATHVIAQKK